MRRPWAFALAAVVLLGAATPPGNVIRVKGVSGDTVVTLAPSHGGGLVRLDLLTRLMGGTLENTAAGQWRLTLYRTTLELQEGIPFAGYNGFVLPLQEPVQLVDGALHAPLQLFSEIIPRFGIGILWDRSRWELRLFQGIARGQPGILRAVEPPATPVAQVSNAAVTPASEAARVASTSAAVEPARAAATNTAPVTAPVSSPAPPTATTVAPAAPTGPPPPKGLARRYTIAVDAGHGGRDPGNLGTIVGGVRALEAKLTLPMALKLEHELKARGLDVVMTRRRDTLIARDERGPIANGLKADLFVSLHTNAANPNWKNGSSVRGVETYFLATARTEDERRVAAMENDVVRFETSTAATKGDPLSFILNDLAQNEHLRESSDLAQVIQASLAKKHPGPDRGVKQAGFAVLATAYMPAVLVEVGFGTNPSDARWMSSAEGQRDIAVSIADGIFEYLQHYERRARAAIR